MDGKVMDLIQAYLSALPPRDKREDPYRQYEAAKAALPSLSWEDREAVTRLLARKYEI